MSYQEFKDEYLASIKNPATGYDGDQEVVITSMYIKTLEYKLAKAERQADHWRNIALEYSTGVRR